VTCPLANGNLDICAIASRRAHSQVHYATSVSIDVQVTDVICWCGFNPDTLPDAAAGSVKDMARVQRLLADRDHVAVAVRRIKGEDDSATISLLLFLTTQDMLRTVRSARH
jgi:hypothetical protein